MTDTGDELTLHQTAADPTALSCVPANAELSRRLNLLYLVSQVQRAASPGRRGDITRLGFVQQADAISYQQHGAGDAATRRDGYDHLFGSSA
jgi:hypothetical protein